MKALKLLLVLTLCSAAALMASPAFAQVHKVTDNLKLFSDDAKAQANKRIAELERVEHKDLVIETLTPPKKPAGLDIKNHDAVKEFFDQYSLERFKALRVDGVYIMILKQPEHILRVDIGNNTRSKGYFTDTDRIELLKILREGLEKDPSAALVRATNYVVDTMEKNHPAGAVQGATKGSGGGGAGFPWSTVLTIGAVILGVWLVLALVRALFSGSGAGGGMGMGAPGYGGGGFMQNFLGGMLGAAAGMWAYNSFFGHGGSSAWGAGPSDAGSSPLGDNAPDTSASVGGDSWGADGGAPDAGGGDWGADAGGGGDWGGGDAGGGDWGGGGGDFGGGGGGDW